MTFNEERRLEQNVKSTRVDENTVYKMRNSVVIPDSPVGSERFQRPVYRG